MALSPTYLATLEQSLKDLAAAKKAALDRKMEMYSTAKFDETGKLIGYGEKGLGAQDVSQMETERRLSGMAEGAGMMRSGQYARDLATSQAAYRADILGKRGDIAGEKQLIDYGLAKDLAEAQAAYGNVPTDGGTGGGGTGGGGTGGGGNKRTVDDKNDKNKVGINPPPEYGKGEEPTRYRTPEGVTSPLPPGFVPKNPEPYVPTPKKDAPQRTPEGVTSPLPPGFVPKNPEPYVPEDTSKRVTSPIPSFGTTPAPAEKTKPKKIIPKPAPTTEKPEEKKPAPKPKKPSGGVGMKYR